MSTQETTSAPKLTIDGKDYILDDLSDQAKAMLQNIIFVDEQILQRSNELAIADTARLGYTNALKRQLAQTKAK